MHDERIAGVTFEENALRNALIVNEEYAWVGNPFSAQRLKTNKSKLRANPSGIHSRGVFRGFSVASGAKF